MAGNRILFFPVTAYHARLQFRDNTLVLLRAFTALNDELEVEIAENIKALFGE